MMTRYTTVLFATALLALLAGCSKDLPSSPGTPPGEPVILNVEYQPGISNNIRLTGSVKNQSGKMIYDVRVGYTVYREVPVPATVTETTAVLIPSLPHDSTESFPNQDIFGNAFIDAFPVWTYLPP